MKHRMKLIYSNQAGETIVEVLICVAVIAAAMVATYVSIQRSYLSLENTRERGVAIKLVESQIEDLRSNSGISSADKCFSFNGSTVAPSNGSGSGSSNPTCIFQSNGQHAAANSIPAYNVLITQSSDLALVNTYTVSATWSGASGKSSTSMEYRTQ